MEIIRPASTMSGPVAANAHPFKDKMPNLDGVRALACLLVIVSHIPWAVDISRIGPFGVGVFFVLSGFLMSYLYAEAAWDTKSVMKYSIARFSRIAPIYWVVITVCLILTQFEGSDFPLRLEGTTAIVRHYMFSGNVSIFWSIPLEVQYYIFFLFVWWCLAHIMKLPFAMSLLVLVCSVLMLTHSYWPNLSVPNKLHFFLAGSLAGMVPRKEWLGASNRLMLNLLQLASVGVLASPWILFDTTDNFYDSVEIAFAYAVAVYLLSISSGWTTLVFATPWMRKIGQASFSIYLIHTLIFYYGAHWFGLSHKEYHPLWVLLGFAGLILPMIISHYVEMPLQRVTRSFLDSTLMGRFSRVSAQTA